MAEGTYEYECMRAELLGLEKPDYEKFIKNKCVQEASAVEVEEYEIENLKEAEKQNDAFSGANSRLDELNSILQSTQKKLRYFKNSCGSITSRIKFKIGGSSTSLNQSFASDNDNPPNLNGTSQSEDDQTTREDVSSDNSTPIRKSDLTKALDNHVDKLDSLIDKAERAEISMSEQTKQMKKFLK